MPISDEHSRLRKMNSELYTTDIQPPIKRSILHGNRTPAPDDWSPSEKKNITMASLEQKKQMPKIFKTVFLGSFAFLLVALVIFGSSFFLGGNSISSDNVNLVITAKSFVDGGEDLPVDVSIVNKISFHWNSQRWFLNILREVMKIQVQLPEFLETSGLLLLEILEQNLSI